MMMCSRSSVRVDRSVTIIYTTVRAAFTDLVLESVDEGILDKLSEVQSIGSTTATSRGVRHGLSGLLFV